MQSPTNKHYDIVACIATHHTIFSEIEKVIASLLNTSLSIKIIIVDDGSGEAYVEALNEELGDLANIISIPQRRGIANAYNHALTQAPPSDSFLIVSLNITMDNNALNILYSYLELNDNIGLITPQLKYENGEVFLSNRRKPTIADLFFRHFIPAPLQILPTIQKHIQHYQMLDIGYDNSCEPDYLDGNVMLFRRSIIERLGGFETQLENYLYDADITMRAKAISKALYYPKSSATLFRNITKRNFQDRINYLRSLWRFSFIWGIKWWYS